MADEQHQQTTEAAQPAGTGQQPEAGRTFTQEDVDSIVSKRLAEERERVERRIAEKYGNLDELAEAREKLRKTEEAQMSELDKLRRDLEKERAARQQQEAEAQAARVGALRLRVGQEVGLPVALAERLQGEDEESLKADAARVLAVLKEAGRSPLPRTDATAGTQQPSGNAKRLTDEQRAAAAKAGLSEEAYLNALETLDTQGA